MMKIQKQMTAVVAMIGFLGMGISTSAQELPAKMLNLPRLKLNIKCEAVTDQQEKYLIYVSMVQNDIQNDYLAPGDYGPLEFTAVPIVGGNRTDEAIMETFDAARISELKDPQGNQLSAYKSTGCRVATFTRTNVDVHFSENTKIQALQIFGIKYSKTIYYDFGGASETTSKNITFVESNCNYY